MKKPDLFFCPKHLNFVRGCEHRDNGEFGREKYNLLQEEFGQQWGGREILPKSPQSLWDHYSGRPIKGLSGPEEESTFTPYSSLVIECE